MARSPLIWFGGKGKYAKRIIDYMPKHQKYREPFVGACHVISQKPRAPFEVINDIDAALVNFILIATEDPEKLQAAVKRIPYSRFLFEKWKKENVHEDPFERAVRFFLLK